MVISVNESDPLRDEGLEFGKKCAQAGVDVKTKTIKGTCHGGDLFTGPHEIFATTMSNIKAFAEERVAEEPAVEQPADGPKCLGYTLETDPRIDPRVSAPFIAAGMGGAPVELPGVSPEMSREEILPATVAMEAGLTAVLEAMFAPYELCVALARCSLCFYPTPTGRLGN